MAKKDIICSVCDGKMNQYVGPRYNRGMGVLMIAGGILCTLFWIGPVLGLPLFIIGLYMHGAKRKLWVCQDCNSAIERIELVGRRKPTSCAQNRPQQNCGSQSCGSAIQVDKEDQKEQRIRALSDV